VQCGRAGGGRGLTSDVLGGQTRPWLSQETHERGLHAAVQQAFPSTPLLQELQAAGRLARGGDTQHTYGQVDLAVQVRAAVHHVPAVQH